MWRTSRHSSSRQVTEHTTWLPVTAVEEVNAEHEPDRGEALIQLGGGLEHVVRTRIFVTDISRWEAVGQAHGGFFADIRPASTMVEVNALIDPVLLVEVEADAVLPS